MQEYSQGKDIPYGTNLYTLAMNELEEYKEVKKWRRITFYVSISQLALLLVLFSTSL